jgi:hypothetical protein
MIVFGWFGRLLLVVVLAGIAALAWLNRDRIPGLAGRMAADTVAYVEPPTAERADSAQRMLEELAAGQRTRVALSASDVQSLLVHRYAQLLPAFVEAPRVTIRGDRLDVLMRVPVDRLPDIDELSAITPLLPDTTDVTVGGHIIALGPGRVGLVVDGVSAARIPIPDALVPRALERLGRRDEPGLPPNGFALPLPRGVRGAIVRADSLVFETATPANAND